MRNQMQISAPQGAGEEAESGSALHSCDGLLQSAGGCRRASRERTFLGLLVPCLEQPDVLKLCSLRTSNQVILVQPSTMVSVSHVAPCLLYLQDNILSAVICEL